MLKVFNRYFNIRYMKNLGILLTTLGVFILFILGLTYYSMLDNVVNSAAFITTFVIIFGVLIIVIASSFKRRKVNKK